MSADLSTASSLAPVQTEGTIHLMVKARASAEEMVYELAAMMGEWTRVESAQASSIIWHASMSVNDVVSVSIRATCESSLR